MKYLGHRGAQIILPIIVAMGLILAFPCISSPKQVTCPPGIGPGIVLE